MKNLYEKDDDLRKEFQDVFLNIRASEELKNDTLTQMQMGREPKEKPLPVKNPKFWYCGIPASILVCVLVFISLSGRIMRASYVTVMEEGVYYDSVELKDGEILFVANRFSISITPNVGEIVIGQEDSEETEVEKVIEENETDAGGTLLYQRAGTIDLPEINEKNWSHIGEQEIYVTVLKTEETQYQAVFEKDGQVFEVIGRNVTQKEFIDYLYRKVKNKVPS